MEAKKNYGHIFGVILSEVKEFRMASFLTPCFMILEVIVETLIPLLMASIVDNGVQKGDMRHILIIGTCMLGLAIAGPVMAISCAETMLTKADTISCADETSAPAPAFANACRSADDLQDLRANWILHDP